MREAWKKEFPHDVWLILEEILEEALAHIYKPLWLITQEVLKSHGKDHDKDLSLIVCRRVDWYLKTLDRIGLIRSIEHEIHLFSPNKAAYDYMADTLKHVIYHRELPFTEIPNLFRQTKISLNSVPWQYYGAHERLFMGLASGCAVATNDNPWVMENFSLQDGVLPFRMLQWKALNENIKFFLDNEEARKAAVACGREKVEQFHTWGARVQELKLILPPFLEKIAF
jgi:hypothetical protein